MTGSNRPTYPAVHRDASGTGLLCCSQQQWLSSLRSSSRSRFNVILPKETRHRRHLKSNRKASLSSPCSRSVLTQAPCPAKTMLATPPPSRRKISSTAIATPRGELTVTPPAKRLLLISEGPVT